MNKFKKVMLGALSVLTLGLFAVVGTKVDAATTFYTASMTGENGSATTFNDGGEIAKDSNLKLQIFGTTAVESSRSVSPFTVGLAAQGNGSTSKYFKFTSLSTSDMNVTVYFADCDSSGKLQAKSYTFGSKTGTTSKGLNNETDELKSENSMMLYSAGRCNLFKVEYEIIEDIEKELSSLVSVATSASYSVGDTVSKSDLVVMALYSGETEAVATTKYSFKVYDSNNDEVEGAFASAGTYRIVATSTEDSTKSVSCNITVAAAITYNVTFHPENGNSNSSVSITKGEKITQDNIPAAPSKDGVSFKGWYTSANAAVTKDTVINADLDVYAQYYESATMPQSGVSNNILNVSNEDDISSGNKNPLTFGIFTAKSTNKGIKINSNNKTAGGMNFTKRLQMQATGSTSDANISATLTKGKLYVVAQVGSLTNDCELKLYNGTEVVASRNIYGQVATAVSFDIEEAGTYTIYGTNTLNYYYVEFDSRTVIPADNTEITVTPLVQKAVDTENGYTYVRFITIVSGVNEFDASDVKFDVTMEYADTSKADKTITYTPYAVKRITSNGETYTDGTHTFGNVDNQYYVVYVLRFTTEKASGNQVYSTVSFNGNSYTSNSETI